MITSSLKWNNICPGKDFQEIGGKFSVREWTPRRIDQLKAHGLLTSAEEESYYGKKATAQNGHLLCKRCSGYMNQLTAA